MSKGNTKTRILIGAGVLITVLLAVWGFSEIKIRKAVKAVETVQETTVSVTEDAARPGGGPALTPEKEEYEEVVASPDGGKSQELAEDDPDYHLESLRRAKQDWHSLEDGTVEYRGKKYRRNNYVKTYLVLGIDTHESFKIQPVLTERGVSDGVFLVVHDTAHDQLKVLMIPRDTITELYHYTEDGQFVGEYLNHIGLAYSQLADPLQGCANTAGAVTKLLCGLEINGITAVNLNTLAALTDAVGGVDVTVPNDQLQIAVPEWKEGTKLHLTGENVELFLRYRDFREQQEDEGPIIRMSQHKEFLAGFYQAVREKAKTGSGIIEELYNILQANMVTTMEKDELLRLGAEAVSSSFSMDDVLMLPGEEEDRDYTEYYADYEKLIPILLDLFYREV